MTSSGPRWWSPNASATGQRGQILASELLAALVGSRGGFRFRLLGPVALEGLPRPVPAVVVDGPGCSWPTAGPATPSEPGSSSARLWPPPGTSDWAAWSGALWRCSARPPSWGRAPITFWDATLSDVERRVLDPGPSLDPTPGVLVVGEGVIGLAAAVFCQQAELGRIDWRAGAGGDAGLRR